MFKLTILILLVPALVLSTAVAYAGTWDDVGFYYPDCRCNGSGWEVWLENIGYRPVKTTIQSTEYPTYYTEYFTKVVYPGESVYVGCTAAWERNWTFLSGYRYYEYTYWYTITKAYYIR